MEYSVGSLADLITGSNTPNKPKVVQKAFKRTSNQSNKTPILEVSPEKGAPEIEKKKPLKNKQKNKLSKKLKKKNTENEEGIKIKADTEVNNEVKRKEKKKRKLDDSTLLSDLDNKTDHSPSKKLKLSKNDHNAERRVKNREKKQVRENADELERTLYVGNIPIQIDKKKVKQYFRKYGKIESIRIRGIPVADPKVSKKVAAIKKEFNPNRKNVYCYIRFANKEDAIKAEAENGALFMEHHLRVHICSSKESPDEAKAIFVGNLSFDAQEDQLWKLFETCGPISYVRIIRDSHTGMGKGFAYVNFKDSDAVQLALEMENVKLGDRELRISLSNLKVAKKKKFNKNKKISQPGKPRERKNTENNEKRSGSTEKKEGVNKPKGGFQGTKFSDKRKKHKVNKGLLQKKKMIKKIAPKPKTEN